MGNREELIEIIQDNEVWNSFQHEDDMIVGTPPPPADAFDDPSSESDTKREYAEDETYQDDSRIEG